MHLYLGNHRQSLLYEGLNLLCTYCGRFGHPTTSCPEVVHAPNEQNNKIQHLETNITHDAIPVKENEWKTVTFTKKSIYPPKHPNFNKGKAATMVAPPAAQPFAETNLHRHEPKSVSEGKYTNQQPVFSSPSSNNGGTSAASEHIAPNLHISAHVHGPPTPILVGNGTTWICSSTHSATEQPRGGVSSPKSNTFSRNSDRRNEAGNGSFQSKSMVHDPDSSSNGTPGFQFHSPAVALSNDSDEPDLGPNSQSHTLLSASSHGSEVGKYAMVIIPMLLQLPLRLDPTTSTVVHPMTQAPMVQHENPNSYMNFLVWNCRGSHNPEFRRHIRSLLDNHRPTLVILLETHMQDHTSLREDINFENMAQAPANGLIGGLVVLWNAVHINVTEMRISDQEIHCVVQVSPTKPPWILSAIYASCHYQLRDIL
ncbi:hypothetical protein A4A49_09023 [Nicotiana attenuata]|uniref:CCHC-type domain-containing protein n=1 Tax=Nicotiana attenuata TaxID=49451 RepID=A0A1J6HUK0_NICAT|nr:hypothetical protein A4A49_09023 [Nicotiana attenuata]